MPFINFSYRRKIRIWEGIDAALYHSEQISFAHVSLQEGAVVHPHQHVHEQWTHVIEGEMWFDVGGEEQTLTPGMAAFIPSNVLHAAKAITACRVIDCFMPIREDFIELEKKSTDPSGKSI